MVGSLVTAVVAVAKNSIPVFNSNSNSNSRVFNSNSTFNSTNSNSNSNSGIGIGIELQFQFQNWIVPNPVAHFVQNYGVPISNALEILQSWIKPLIVSNGDTTVLH